MHTRCPLLATGQCVLHACGQSWALQRASPAAASSKWCAGHGKPCEASAAQAPYAGLSEGKARLSKLLPGAGLLPPVTCPPALAALLEACLAGVPAERPPARKIAAELRAMLKRACGGGLLRAWPGFI